MLTQPGQDGAHRKGVNALAWEPESQRLASGGRDGLFLIHERRTAAESYRKLAGRQLFGWLTDVCWVNASMSLSTGFDGHVRLYREMPNDELSCEAFPHPRHGDAVNFDYATCLAMLRGRGLAVAGRLGCAANLHAYDLETLQQVLSFDGHRESVYSLAAASDVDLLASGAADRCVRVWDARQAVALSAKVHVDCDMAKALCFSPDSRSIYAGCMDGTVRVWDVGTRRLRARYSAPDASSVWALEALPDGTVLLGTRSGKLALLEPHRQADDPLAVLELSALGVEITDLAHDAAAHGVWLSTTHQTIHYVSLGDNQGPDLAREIPGRQGIVRHAVMPSRLHALTLSDDGEVASWNLLTAECHVVRASLGDDEPEQKGAGFDKLVASYSEREASSEAPAWCTVASDSGALVVSLETSSSLTSTLDWNFIAQNSSADRLVQNDARAWRVRPSHIESDYLSSTVINPGCLVLTSLFAPLLNLFFHKKSIISAQHQLCAAQAPDELVSEVTRDQLLAQAAHLYRPLEIHAAECLRLPPAMAVRLSEMPGPRVMLVSTLGRLGADVGTDQTLMSIAVLMQASHAAGMWLRSTLAGDAPGFAFADGPFGCPLVGFSPRCVRLRVTFAHEDAAAPPPPTELYLDAPAGARVGALVSYCGSDVCVYQEPGRPLDASLTMYALQQRAADRTGPVHVVLGRAPPPPLHAPSLAHLDEEDPARQARKRSRSADGLGDGEGSMQQ